MSLDSKGRLFSVRSAYGHTGIAVISPPGTETVITDNFEGMPFGRPNDLIVDKKGGVYFTDPLGLHLRCERVSGPPQVARCWRCYDRVSPTINTIGAVIDRAYNCIVNM
jgi:sugar lactone lactonase YvrE